jgi:hypothetical protein
MKFSRKLSDSLVGLSACLMLCSGTAFGEVVLIAHPSAGVSAISAQDAKNIFLGKSKSFPNGAAVTPADQPDGSAAKDAFYAKVVEKDPAQLKAYWSKMVFSGRGTPPNVVGDDETAKKWVASNPSGLSYVDSSAVDDSVKVVLTVP